MQHTIGMVMTTEDVDMHQCRCEFDWIDAAIALIEFWPLNRFCILISVESIFALRADNPFAYPQGLCFG